MLRNRLSVAAAASSSGLRRFAAASPSSSSPFLLFSAFAATSSLALMESQRFAAASSSSGSHLKKTTTTTSAPAAAPAARKPVVVDPKSSGHIQQMSSLSSTPPPPPPAAAASAEPDAPTETALLMKKILELEIKTDSWTLTADDVKFALATLRTLSDANAISGQGKADALISDDLVMYHDETDPAKGQHVPFVMSALYRCLVNYNGWCTLSGNSDPTNKGEYVMQLRRPQTPARDLYAAPFAAGSLPSGINRATGESEGKSSAKLGGAGDENDDGDAKAADLNAKKPTADSSNKAAVLDKATKGAAVADGRLFLLSTSTELIAPMAAELKGATGSASTPTVSGFELYQLARLLCQQQADTVRFDGISILGPDAGNTTLIANDANSQNVIKAMSCDAALEQAIVLIKWLVEESPETQLRGHKALFVGQSVKSVLEHATYYCLTDALGANFLFTSMHHLLRYRDFATQNASVEWEQRGPWRVGTTDGKNLVWDAPDRPVLLNPAGPGDEAATRFPCFNICFSAPALEQMKRIAAAMP